MKTLAGLKRVKPGQVFKIIYSKYPNHKYLNSLREINHVQSNALTFKGLEENKPSWLTFPKASDFIGTEKGFKILENGEMMLEYEEVK